MIGALSPLIKKEISVELRKRSVLAGIAVYQLSLVFICYLAFNFGHMQAAAITWSALFWLTLLFSVINTVAKSFISERKGLTIYIYSLAPASHIILVKIIYNGFLCMILSLTGLLFFQLFLPTNYLDYWLLAPTLVLSSLGFSGCLSLVSAISSKSGNSNVIMAVLSFPVILGILLMSIRVTKNVIDQLDRSASYDELLNLIAIDAIVITLSYILFPFVWRS